MNTKNRLFAGSMIVALLATTGCERAPDADPSLPEARTTVKWPPPETRLVPEEPVAGARAPTARSALRRLSALPFPGATSPVPPPQPSAQLPAPSPNAYADSRVVVYGTTWCGPCKDLKRQLDARGIPHVFIDIENRTELATPAGAHIVEMPAEMRQSVPATRVVERDGKPTWVRGDDPTRVERAYRGA